MKLPPFYPIIDADRIAAVPAAEAILDAGARILQYRRKSFFSREAFEEASRIAELCRSAGALFIVNDRADIALLLNAGLHLGQDDLAPSDARKLLPAPSIIGFSTHNEQQLRAGDSEPVDYLAIGPIFATGSKAESRSRSWIGSIANLADAHDKTSGGDRGNYPRSGTAGFRSGSGFGGDYRRPDFQSTRTGGRMDRD